LFVWDWKSEQVSNCVEHKLQQTRAWRRKHERLEQRRKKACI
jgi:hypothetical protein